ncbi:uncharacterized protein EURHEDRAFT_291626 [Aspergillus ruber CBS 135680]|uniref:Uncharacterized protein n=1 Tax=Aspergillus ruber (strain CBS 135680) TaxID=1388766 RepID=A0A017S2N0_ASPRC|nr:uncharacterized protein EURHEDRAFT_291626 [Aspergillus ruber CBS 135680]EYE90430.1 hypothetical protein EURHEDRAFT_291626 [Aspergillus ruber CBS 135680]
MDPEDSSRSSGEEEDIISNIDDAAEEQPSAFTHLTDAKSNPLQTLFIEYTDDLPEYPRTHIHGYTYIVSVVGRLQEAEHLIQDIQYSRASIRGARASVKSSFLNCSVKKWMWKCSGALICEYLKPSLRTLYHTYLDETAWEEIQSIRKNIDLIERDIRKRNAYRWLCFNCLITST